MQIFAKNTPIIAINGSVQLQRFAVFGMSILILASSMGLPVRAQAAGLDRPSNKVRLLFAILNEPQVNEDRLRDAVISAAEPVEVETIQRTHTTVQEVLLEVCEERGYGEECARHLLGMLWKESNNIPTAIGDGGRARGYFQIHYRLHKITTTCAEDLECSANWTIDYLEQNGYPKNVRWSVQCHNGCGIWNGYVESALRHGKRLWSKPLPLAAKELGKEVAIK